MMCVCPNTPMPVVPSYPNLSVNYVPPQLKNLVGLLGLPDLVVKPRIDQKLGQVLPANDKSWISSTMSAQAPSVTLPSILPPGFGIALSAMMRLGMAGQVFPVMKPKQLASEMTLAIKNMTKFAMPRLRPVMHVPWPQLQRMALAARLTLDMRAKGVCPMVMANVSMTAGYANSGGAFQAAMSFAANMPKLKVPPIALPLPKIQLAQQLAAMSGVPAASQGLGLPAMHMPNFMPALQSQLQMMAQMPMPMQLPMAELQEMTAKLADIDVIEEAFGPDALTPGGVSRVNAMLKFFTKMRLPLPVVAMEMKEQLDVLPELEDVTKGMEAVQSSGSSFATSAAMSTSVAIPPIIPTLESLTTFGNLTAKMTGVSPFGGCLSCSSELKDIGKSLSNLSLPKAPSLAQML